MGKNRTIKNIIKKRIVINSKGESRIKNSLVQPKPTPKLISTPSPKKVIRIFDPRARKQIIEPKGLSKHEIRDYKRTGIINKSGKRISPYANRESNNIILKEKYFKKENIDYDVVIVITSYNRYNKSTRILKQLFEQKTKHTFKVIFLNDGSSEEKYENIKTNYPMVKYLKNKTNGGKIFYWRTVSKLYSEVKKYKTHAMCQIDDDLILCDNFIDRVLDLFFNKKYENNRIVGIHYHPYWYYGKNKHIITSHNAWGNTGIITDGGTIFDIEFIKYINYKIPEIDSNRWKINPEATSNVWTKINEKIKEYDGITHESDYSLVYNDGNDDSKLNTEVRKRGGHVYTDNFIDNKKIQY